MMTPRREKIRIEVFRSADYPDAAENPFRMSDEVLLRLARLIGHQMAREQFERELARERNQLHKRRCKKLP